MTTLRPRLEADETLYGAWCGSADPAVIGAAAQSGVDFVVLDLQHGAAGEPAVPVLAAAAEAGGAVALVRVRQPTFADIGRPLDLGAHGVIVPNIDSVDQARTATAAVRYPPQGNRSAGRMGGGSDDPLCVLMVETRQALRDVEQIAALDGVDGILIGPNDLSRSIGCSYDLADPTLRAALDRVAEACARAGRPLGTYARDAREALLLRRLGQRIVLVGSDLAAVRSQLAGALDHVRQAPPG